jgi:hypothetical protein
MAKPFYGVDGNLLVEERAAMSTPGWYQRLQGHA